MPLLLLSSSSSRGALVLLVVATLSLFGVVESTHYKQGESVPLYANKVGPFANPSEQYEYYTLPFCAPKSLERKKLHLGAVLGGDRLMTTQFDLPFGVNLHKKTLCTYTLSKENVQAFQDAIQDDYYFEFIYDDLPVWGFIGEVQMDEDTPRYFLFTHYIFSISYNNDRIVEVQWEYEPGGKTEITKSHDTPITFSYTAKWTESSVQYEERHQTDHVQSHQLEIHWFSIFNSLVTVLLLTGFLSTILLRILKNDFTRYAREDELEADENDETGWKLVHGDVFRFPSNPILFSAVIGNGSQLLAACIGVLVLAVFGAFYPTNRGGLFVAALLLYALTSGIGGYVSNVMYKKMGGENWVWNTVATSCLFLGPFVIVSSFLNTVAIAYKSSTALPFGTIVVLFLILFIGNFPLLVLGGIAGRNLATPFEAPCRTTKVPREIPPLPWYRQAVSQVVMAGFLPFSAIYIELYYVFVSVWGHKDYSLYGILFLVFIILLIVTSFITIALTYFQLAIEDHRWWWRSIFSGGSTGLFVYGYSIFYYNARSSMKGFMQAAFFFGYMAVVCFGFALMLGSIGFFSSLLFVKYIYRSIKCD